MQQRTRRSRTTQGVLALALLTLPALAVLGTRAEAATSVTSSAVASITILPNDRPTTVPIETDQQFVATAYAEDGTVVPSVTFRWKVGGGIGRITSDGIFTGERGGIGTVTATNGDVTGSVGVVVQGVAKKKTQPSTNAAPQQQATNRATAPSSNANANVNAEPTVPAGENVAPIAETVETAKTCTTLRGWLWVLILLAYLVLLFVYYLALGENRTMWWWVWPLVLTAELLALFWILRCPGMQWWVPIVLLLFGSFATYVYVQLLRPKDYQQFTQPPAQPPSTPQA